jgi:hypothetical protein
MSLKIYVGLMLGVIVRNTLTPAFTPDGVRSTKLPVAMYSLGASCARYHTSLLEVYNPGKPFWGEYDRRLTSTCSSSELIREISSVRRSADCHSYCAEEGRYNTVQYDNKSTCKLCHLQRPPTTTGSTRKLISYQCGSGKNAYALCGSGNVTSS